MQIVLRILALRVPELLSGTDDSVLLGLQLVGTVEGNSAATSEQVEAERVELGESSLGDIVSDAGAETSVAVDNKKRGQGEVGNRGESAGDEGPNGEGDHTQSDKTLVAPVVRAVESISRGGLDSVVDGTGDVSGRLGDTSIVKELALRGGHERPDSHGAEGSTDLRSKKSQHFSVPSALIVWGGEMPVKHCLGLAPWLTLMAGRDRAVWRMRGKGGFLGARHMGSALGGLSAFLLAE